MCHFYVRSSQLFHNFKRTRIGRFRVSVYSLRLVGYTFAGVDIETPRPRLVGVCLRAVAIKFVNTLKFHVSFPETSVGVGYSGVRIKQTFTTENVPF